VFKDLDVDEAVKKGTIQPGKYLILQFDFSCVSRPHNISESTDSLHREMNLGLRRFKRTYGKHLGEFFASKTSGFRQHESTDNLRNLIDVVDFVLQDIHRTTIPYGMYEEYFCWQMSMIRLQTNTWIPMA